MKMKKAMLLSTLLVLAMLVGLLSACTGAPTTTATTAPNGTTTTAPETSATTAPKTIKFLSIWAEDNDNSKLILELTDEYKDITPGFDLEFEFVAPADLVSKVKILLSSDDLPDTFAYESATPLLELIDANAILDVEKTFTELGIMDSLDQGAVSLLKTLVGGRGLYDLPLGLNVEGIWYHKADFATAGITKVPETWTELMDACEKLKAAGIQPFTAGGKDKWPLTRLINMYVFRSMGVDAMRKAANGEAAFTDAGYVKAAAEIQGMAQKGYFGTGIVTVDYGTAADVLFSGKAAMLYNGSWFAENLNDPARNLAGEDGIGFFNVPLVEGGPGKLDEYSMNCGNTLCFSAKKYDASTGEWMKYVFTRLGDKAMAEYGAFKGYAITTMPSDVSNYTKLVGEQLAAAKGSTLWFEASMDAKTSTLAQDNVQSLVNNEMTPEEYCKQLEESMAEYRASK